MTMTSQIADKRSVLSEWFILSGSKMCLWFRANWLWWMILIFKKIYGYFSDECRSCPHESVSSCIWIVTWHITSEMNIGALSFFTLLVPALPWPARCACWRGLIIILSQYFSNQFCSLPQQCSAVCSTVPGPGRVTCLVYSVSAWLSTSEHATLCEDADRQL